MQVPYSKNPTESLYHQLEMCLHTLGDAERLAYEVGLADHDAVKLCQAAMSVTQAATSLLHRDNGDTQVRIKAAIEQLHDVQSSVLD